MKWTQIVGTRIDWVAKLQFLSC